MVSGHESFAVLSPAGLRACSLLMRPPTPLASCGTGGCAMRATVCISWCPRIWPLRPRRRPRRRARRWMRTSAAAVSQGLALFRGRSNATPPRRASGMAGRQSTKASGRLVARVTRRWCENVRPHVGRLS
eukprot:scaffold21265_cov131-Isochrysis_galbana.AAC.10